jgi:hypothetical protein
MDQTSGAGCRIHRECYCGKEGAVGVVNGHNERVQSRVIVSSCGGALRTAHMERQQSQHFANGGRWAGR